MASQLSIPSNISLGTFFSDGLRAGPSYSGFRNGATPGSASLQPDENGNIVTNDYNDFGRGLLYSPQNTWNIVPYASIAGNIVAAAAVTTAKYLPFTQDTFATTQIPRLQGTQNGNNTYIQFDWPRVPAVVVAGAAMAGPTNVTIFGGDWYGMPMQMTYVVQATGTYPANLGAAAKAFYTITAVYVNGATGVGGTVAVQTTNTFGLPYCVKEWSDVMNFSWNGNSMVDQSGITSAMTAGVVSVNTPAVLSTSPIIYSRRTLGGTAGNVALTAAPTARTSFSLTSSSNTETSTYSWLLAQGGQNLVSVADTTFPATEFTGDTRGLFKLPETGETWASVPNGARRALVTVYSMGSDNFQNQLAAGNQPQGAGTVAPLTSTDLYGVQQYYTGIAA